MYALSIGNTFVAVKFSIATNHAGTVVGTMYVFVFVV
jgi:hypothetical protein